MKSKLCPIFEEKRFSEKLIKDDFLEDTSSKLNKNHDISKFESMHIQNLLEIFKIASKSLKKREYSL